MSNAMVFCSPNQVLEEDLEGIEEMELRKWVSDIKKCKGSLWRRWSNEYVKALRVRHSLKHGKRDAKIAKDVFVIKSEERN